MYSSVGAVPPGSGWFVTVSLLSLWRLAPDSSLESARSDSRFRRDWCEESRPLWPWSVAHLFIWDDKYFDQPLPQLAIDWEDSSADAHFFLERTPARRRNTLQTSPQRDQRGKSSLFLTFSLRTAGRLTQPHNLFSQAAPPGFRAQPRHEASASSPGSRPPSTHTHSGSVAKNILTTFYNGNVSVFAAISCVTTEFLQQSRSQLDRCRRDGGLFAFGLHKCCILIKLRKGRVRECKPALKQDATKSNPSWRLDFPMRWAI